MKTTILKKPAVAPFFPGDAVRFIRDERPEQEIFSEYGWGGYLIWSLYPEYRVFIDGRGLFPSVYKAYVKSLSGAVGKNKGIPEWKAFFDMYGVKAVLVPGTSIKGGGFIRLVRRLADDDEWSLVYVGKETLLFIKNTEKNREIIRLHSVPKVLAYAKALEQAEFYRTQNPALWQSYATLGEINLYIGRPDAALGYFEAAVRLNPSLKSTSFNVLVERVKSGMEYSSLLDEIFK